MAGELIFITGATGFVGSATALAALKAGYRLRVCVRKASEKLQALLSEYSEQVEYVTIPDLTEETAFQGKLNGVDYILHLASAVPRGADKKDYFIPAVKGTTVLLKEAASVASIKKVVVTSSRAALIPLTGIPAGGIVKGKSHWFGNSRHQLILHFPSIFRGQRLGL
jgi:nucleoside-diphosphate-sugar epimerase